MTHDTNDLDRVRIVLTERPPATVLMALHRTLGIGVSTVVQRISSRSALLDARRWHNDWPVVHRLLHDTLTLVAPYEHQVIEGAAVASDAQSVLASLAAHGSTDGTAPPPVGADPDLSRLIAGAAQRAIEVLRRRHPEQFYAFGLLTSGEALSPHLSACSVQGDEASGLRWSFPDSPYAVWRHDLFDDVTSAFEARGSVFDHADPDAEYDLRLASMEEAWRLLDADGFFGTGADRSEVLLLVEQLPPSPQDTATTRRLNPASPLRDEWLEQCSEQAPLPTEVRRPAGVDSLPHPAPNPAIADLWALTPGLLLDDGTNLYGPDELSERNTTFEVASYSPGWVLVGDDSGGTGFLMRRSGPTRHSLGRAAAEVWALGLGALCPDVAARGEFVTDDLIGWLVERTA